MNYAVRNAGARKTTTRIKLSKCDETSGCVEAQGGTTTQRRGYNDFAGARKTTTRIKLRKFSALLVCSLHQFDLARSPLLGKERFERAAPRTSG
jgi:hypothetical protein